MTTPAASLQHLPARRALRSLAHRDFRLLFTANMSNDVAMWALNIAIGWLMFQLTHSTFQLGLLFFLRGMALLVAAPLGGTLADRLDARLLVGLAQVALVLAGAALAVLTLGHTVAPWHVYLLMIVVASAHGVGNPTRQAMVFDVTSKDDLANAVSINNVGMNIMRVVGPVASGVLLGTAGSGGVFVLSASVWVVTGLAVGMIRSVSRVQVKKSRPSFFQSFRDGLSYARRDRSIGQVLLVALVFNALAMMFQQLMSAYAGDVLDLGGRGYGLLMAGVGGGAVAGAVATTALGDRAAVGWVLLASVALTGLGLMFLAAGTLNVAVPALVVIGVSSAVAMGVSAVLIQTKAENTYRGRVTALYLLTFGLQSLGSLPAGAIAEAIGLQTTFLIMGALVVGLTAWFAAGSPRLRQMQAGSRGLKPELEVALRQGYGAADKP